MKGLPECMQICFWTLYNTTMEISSQIEMERGWNSVLPHLQQAVCCSKLNTAELLINGPLFVTPTIS